MIFLAVRVFCKMKIFVFPSLSITTIDSVGWWVGGQ